MYLKGWTKKDWYREAFELARATKDRIQKMALYRLHVLERGLSDQSRDVIVKKMDRLNQERLAAVPDLLKYPELRGVADLIRASWEGARDGAELDFPEWVAHCDGGFYYHRNVLNVGRSSDKDPSRCTYIYFHTSDEGPILANNLDSSLKEPYGAPTWPAINEHLIYGGVSSGIFYDELSPEIFPVPIKELVARYCRTTEEAVEFLTRYKLFWGPGNVILIDRQNRIAVIEKSACRIGVRYLSDGFGFVTSMTAADPEFRAYLVDRRENSLKERGLGPDSGDAHYWKAADRRHALLEELLAEAKKCPTYAELKRLIQYRSDHGNVLVCGDSLGGGAESAYTLRTTIWKLSNLEAHWQGINDNNPIYEAPVRTEKYVDVLPWME